MSQPSIRYSLPLPPSINHYYVTTRQGQRVPSKQTKDWMRTAQAIIALAVCASGWKFSLAPKLVMRIWVFWPDKRRRDMNNLHKPLCDAPEGIVYHDDKCVLVWDMDYSVDKENPRVEVEICPACLNAEKVEGLDD